ncbi:hypothetical protein DVH24_033127 [Malus domestica]|uniref:Cytochrome P450 n=1 Tax=Malus domestica TaxID=3750 RepID=A0A498JFR3_MALDO|nr:hypothetical protein DVH24_033127 [Malus domestica]
MALSGLLLPISSIIFIFLAYKLYQRPRFKLPPGPRPWPVVGNLYQIKPVRFRCYAEWAEKYGPIFSVWIGSTLNVVVSNTEVAKEVLKENDQKLADRHRNRSTARFSRDGQDLIWADYGPHYVKVRKACTLELFSAKRLEDLRPIREDEVTAMVESIFNHCTKPENHGKSLAVKKYLGNVAFNNITRLAFGKRFIISDEITDEQGKRFRALMANGVKISGSLSVAEHISWLRWACPFDEEAFARHGANRDKLTKEIMDEHTLARSKGGVAKSHFVDALFTLKDKYDLSMDTVIGLLWLYQRLRFKLPPGPCPWPVVGNLYQIQPVRFRCYAEWAEKYGPIFSVWIGSTLNVAVSNTELAKEVLKENDQKLADRHRNRSTAKFSRDGQDLIWADYGPHYVKVRKVCTLELFSAKRLEDLRPIREDEVTAMVESIFNHCTKPENHGKSLAVKKYLGNVAFNNITRLAFGKRFISSDEITDEQGKRFRALIANGVKIGGSLSVAEHISWLRWACPFDEEAFARHGANRDRLTKEIMDEHALARSKGGVAKSHFVDALFTLKDKYDLSMDTIIGLLWHLIRLRSNSFSQPFPIGTIKIPYVFDSHKTLHFLFKVLVRMRGESVATGHSEEVV